MLGLKREYVIALSMLGGLGAIFAAKEAYKGNNIFDSANEAYRPKIINMVVEDETGIRKLKENTINGFFKDAVTNDEKPTAISGVMVLGKDTVAFDIRR